MQVQKGSHSDKAQGKQWASITLESRFSYPSGFGDVSRSFSQGLYNCTFASRGKKPPAFSSIGLPIQRAQFIGNQAASISLWVCRLSMWLRSVIHRKPIWQLSLSSQTPFSFSRTSSGPLAGQTCMACWGIDCNSMTEHVLCIQRCSLWRAQLKGCWAVGLEVTVHMFIFSATCLVHA